MNTEQLELQNRIKLLMEYDMKHTLSENTKLILEIGIPGWVKTLSKNVLDDVVSNTGGVLKTIGGKSVSSSDDLLKVLRGTGKNSLDDISRELLRNSLLKNSSVSITQKSNLIKDLVNNQVTITKYANNTNSQIFSKFRKAGYPDDVSKTIADKLKPGQSVPKPNIGGKTNTGGNVDDVFLTNTKKLRSDFETIFPDASSSDIAKLVNNVKLGLPTSEKAVESLFKSAVSNFNPTYLRTLQKNANKISYWERYLALPKKLKYGLLALGAVGSCAYITPVFGTDCSTLLADITNFITSGVYNTAKKIKRPGSTPGTTPETITTESQLRSKYPCINGEVGLKISQITNNKCVFTYSDGTTDNIIINGGTATFEDGASICQ